MLSRLFVVAALIAFAPFATAQTARVLLDTDRGPIVVELDTLKAPLTSANFLRYVDEGVYNQTLLQRVATNFVVQGGGFRADGTPVTKRAMIPSERNNGLFNTPGTIAMALTGNPANVNSATSDFFFNIGNNIQLLDGTFTVFGRVVFGLRTLAEVNATPRFVGTEQPIRMPLIKRAVRVAPNEFPILPIHTGVWYDPTKSGTGFTIQVGQTDGSTGNPMMLVGWYTFHEGRQIWLSGIASFAWGASQVEIPVQISSGGQFGDAYAPAQVTGDPAWGRVTVRFSGCNAGTFSYASKFGNGSQAVRAITLPTDMACSGN